MSSIFGDSAWTRPPQRSRSSRVVLGLARVLKPLIVLFGIDFATFRVVLANRIELGERVVAQERGAKVGARGGLLFSGLFLMFFSLGPAALALGKHDAVWWMASGLGVWMFFGMLGTVGHFVGLLVDRTDVVVLASLPVSDRTVVAARAAHMLIDLMFLAACSALLPTIAGCIAFEPWTALLMYPLSTLLITLVVLSATLAFTMVLLRVVGPARFQRVLFWTQIIGAASLAILFQAGGRLIPWDSVKAAFESHTWLAALVPPLHYVSLFRVACGTSTAADVLPAALGVGLPLVLAAAAFALVSRSFLAAVADSGALTRTAARGFGSGPLARLAPRLCTTPTAAAAFGFTLAMSRREKTYLRTTLPQMASFGAMAIAMFVKSSRRGSGMDIELIHFAPYYFVFVAPLTLTAARPSEHSEARWWFGALPVSSVRELLEGAAKALLCGMVLPATVIVAALVVVVGGLDQFFDVVLAVFAVGAAVCFQARWFLRDIPFTRKPLGRAYAGSVLETIAVLVAAIGMGFVHAALRLHPIALGAGIVVYAVLFVVAWRGLARIRPEPGALVARFTDGS